MATPRKVLDRPGFAGSRGPVKSVPKTTWGENILSACDRSGMSLNELAKRAGVSRSTLDRMLSGASETSVEKLNYVAQVLGLKVHQLLLPSDQFEDVV